MIRLPSRLSCTLLFLSLFTALQALAWSPTFGPEFNFTNDEMSSAVAVLGSTKKSSDYNRLARDEMRDVVAQRCPDCRIETFVDKDGNDVHRVFHPNGWDFSIMLDVGVVEVIATPMTVEEIEKHKDEMQRLIFASAKKVGMKSITTTAGQLHIGIASAFEGSVLHFRNFVADWIYHSAATYAAFGANYNAPTLDQLGKKYVAALGTVLQSFDQQFEKTKQGLKGALNRFGKMLHLKNEAKEKAEGHQKIIDLAHSIVVNVYTKTIQAWSPASKYQNLNLNHIWGVPESDTVELRGVPEFKSISEYLTFAKMIKGRLQYLKQFSEPIPYQGVKAVKSRTSQVATVADYVQKSNVPWKEIQPLLMPTYQNIQVDFLMCRKIYQAN